MCVFQIVSGCLTFALSPPSSAEPPKEKPPPPPCDSSDDESPVEATRSLHRLDSTKRIKKEIRQKRSNFLGIEGMDDSYLDPGKTRKITKKLHLKSVIFIAYIQKYEYYKLKVFVLCILKLLPGCFLKQKTVGKLIL